MSTSAREDNTRQLESLPQTLESLRSEVERMSTDLQNLQSRFQQSLQQAVTAVAAAADEQLKEAVTAAEQVVRKQLLSDLRTKYGRELELVLTEKERIERRLQAATKQFEEQMASRAAKLSE